MERLIQHMSFEKVVTATVVSGALLVGVESYSGVRSTAGTPILAANIAILAVLSIEMIARFRKHPGTTREFFSDPWNCFDAVLIALAIVPLTAGVAGAVRLARLLKVIRLVRAMPKLRMLVITTLSSIPSIVSISVLMMLLFYVYAVSAVFLFGENDPVHFGDLHTAVVSLFRVITLEDWTDIMYIQMHGCAAYGYEDMAQRCTASTAFGPIGAGFFISFVFTGTWVMLNLFIGVILTGMDQARVKVEEAESEELAEAERSLGLPLRLADDELGAQIDELRRSVEILEQHREVLSVGGHTDD